MRATSRVFSPLTHLTHVVNRKEAVLPRVIREEAHERAVFRNTEAFFQRTRDTPESAKFWMRVRDAAVTFAMAPVSRACMVTALQHEVHDIPCSLSLLNLFVSN